jgi:hypothetical protein
MTARQTSEKHPAFPDNERTVLFTCDGDKFEIEKAYNGIISPPLR